MSRNLAIKGRVVFVSDKYIILARGLELYHSFNDGTSWKLLTILPSTLFESILCKFGLLRRLFRLGVHHVAMYDGVYTVFVNRKIIRINNFKDVSVSSIKGSRPLSICQNHIGIYYGEYYSNSARSSVNVWFCPHDTNEWICLDSFYNVRHIHGVYWDKYSNSIWITTGDNDDESAIWKTCDNFKSKQLVVGGSQQTRAVSLLFQKDYIYFGSDTPNEKNYLYRIARNTFEVTRLQSVGSSVFFGCNIGNSLFFSTAVEPSLVNREDFVELWRSDNGIDWYLYEVFKKDCWSLKYFQYGQLLFPNVIKSDNTLYYSLFSTVDHDTSIRQSITNS